MKVLLFFGKLMWFGHSSVRLYSALLTKAFPTTFPGQQDGCCTSNIMGNGMNCTTTMAAPCIVDGEALIMFRSLAKPTLTTSLCTGFLSSAYARHLDIQLFIALF